MNDITINPIAPMNDQDRISPYNINTIWGRQVVRKKENINQGIISWSNTKFSKLTWQELYGRQLEELLMRSWELKGQQYFTCYHIKQIEIDSTLLLVCSVSDNRGHQNVVKTSVNPLTPRSNLYFSLLSTIHNSYNVSSENVVLDQLIIPKLIFFFILITYLVDIVLIL